MKSSPDNYDNKLGNVLMWLLGIFAMTPVILYATGWLLLPHFFVGVLSSLFVGGISQLLLFFKLGEIARTGELEGARWFPAILARVLIVLLFAATCYCLFWLIVASQISINWVGYTY